MAGTHHQGGAARCPRLDCQRRIGDQRGSLRASIRRPRRQAAHSQEGRQDLRRLVLRAHRAPTRRVARGGFRHHRSQGAGSSCAAASMRATPFHPATLPCFSASGGRCCSSSKHAVRSPCWRNGSLGQPESTSKERAQYRLSRWVRHRTPKTTLRLTGATPPEVWNRLGTKVLPKLRQGERLTVAIDCSVHRGARRAKRSSRDQAGVGRP